MSPMFQKFDQEWADALNEMLSHPAVNKCNDYHAIHKLLAQAIFVIFLGQGEKGKSAELTVFFIKTS